MIVSDIIVIEIAIEMENGHSDQGPDSFTWEAVTESNMDNANTDLILAAKLGKSLLEQNEELSSRYYKIVRKLEVAFIWIFIYFFLIWLWQHIKSYSRHGVNMVKIWSSFRINLFLG